MGKCWHEPNRKSGNAKCIHCKIWIDMDDVANLCGQFNPDFSSPATWHELIQFLIKEHFDGIWKEFVDNQFMHVDAFHIPYLLSNFLQIPLTVTQFAAFLCLPETIERWGWGECNWCNGSGKWKDVVNGSQPCQCSGTGRILTPWAIYAKKWLWIRAMDG